MIGRVLLAALLAGVAAGVLMGAIQYLRLTPMILAAEAYENAPAHEHAEGTAEHAHDAEAWAPQDGIERTFYTTVASMMAGAGFAAALAGVSLLAGIPVTARNGAVWGLCGFIAVTLAPAAGLPPELPGMAAADLAARQVWWIGTIVATGIGLYLIAARRELWAIAAAVALIALPHLIGAPQAASHASGVPAGLAAAFATNSIAANAVFWVLIGVFLGAALKRVDMQEHAA